MRWTDPIFTLLFVFCVYVCICVRVRACACMHACMHACACTCVFAVMCVHVCLLDRDYSIAIVARWNSSQPGRLKKETMWLLVY